jgi:quercetin dioxygenase-like cupin family protein
MTPKIIRKAEGQILMGGRQTIKLRSEDTNETMAKVYSVVPAGSGIPAHIHSLEDETFEITEGELEITIDGEVHVLVEGDMIFMPRDISHGFKAIKDTSMWVTLVPGGSERLFVELAALPPGPPDMKKVSAIADTYGIKFI